MSAMGRAEQTEIRARIVIEQPVPGVLHSLQEDDAPLDAKQSKAGEPLVFEFPLRVAPADGGAKFFGKQVRREGPVRRFVYIRIGTSAGQHLSPWTRRMKIDIHDIDPALLDRAIAGGSARRHDQRHRQGRQPGLRDDPPGDLAR